MRRQFSTLVFVFAIALLFALPSEARKVFVESDGIVVIEAESSSSKPGKWAGKTDIEGFTGKGHIEYTGNKPAGGPVGSTLVYFFKIEKAGAYTLHLRAHKRLDGEEPDKCNDAYVRVEGDYKASDKAGDKHGNDARLEVLRKDTKLFGGLKKGWGWAETLDLGGHNNKRNPRYIFEAGKTYALGISGRSQRFNIDRIVFRHEAVDLKKAKDPERPESDIDKKK
ncbi:MAG: hypothetical protein AB8C95_15925 [Phycisphaeraceae bacterium]